MQITTTKTWASWKVLAAGIMAGGLLCHANAAVLVSFNSPDYVSGAQNMNGYVAGATSIAYSNTQTRNPSANYNTSIASAIFYGGVQTTVSGGLTNYRMNNTSATWDSNKDFMSAISTATGAVIGDTITMLNIWQQSSFLSGPTTGGISIDPLTSSVSSIYRSGLSNTNAYVRLVIQEGSNYYISAQFGVTASGTVKESGTLTNLSSVSWYLYDPAAMATIGSQVNLGTTNIFDSITGFGIWVQGGVMANGVAPRVEIGSFIVNATAVPEPSVAALCLLSLAGVGFVCRGKIFRRVKVSG